MTDDTQNAVPFPENEIRLIPLALIEPDDNQAREEFKEDELIESIKVCGQLDSIHVTTGDDGKYKIVDGERRYRAFEKLLEQNKGDVELANKYSAIRATYVENNPELASILVNINRNNYNSMETADAYAKLKVLLGKHGKKATNEVVGKIVGKAPNTVSEYLSLHELPEEIQRRARADSRVPHNKMLTLVRLEGTPDEKIKE